MKKIISLIFLTLIISNCLFAAMNSNFMDPRTNIIHDVSGNVNKSTDDPNYITGALNYYAADRNPTTNEPTINPGYFDPIQILWWKNTITADLFLLKNAVNNGDGTYALTWVQISVQNIN